MALTRRTQRFADLAAELETQLQDRGIDLDAKTVDVLLNAKVSDIANVLGMSNRAALDYAPETLPTTLCEAVAIVLSSPSAPRLPQVSDA